MTKRQKERLEYLIDKYYISNLSDDTFLQIVEFARRNAKVDSTVDFIDPLDQTLSHLEEKFCEDVFKLIVCFIESQKVKNITKKEKR